jgi:mRNA interferase MazF
MARIFAMRKGDVWLINLDPTIGAEIKKTRPAVIVSEDAIGVLPLKVVVPVTDWKDRYAVAPWMVRLDPDGQNKLDKTSAADCFQVRSVSQERFVRLVGSLPRLHMVEIEIALARVLGTTARP